MKAILALLILITSPLFAEDLGLKNSQNQFDYVIITIDDFIPTCETFKAHKESYNNFSVLVTTRDQILSEFNSDSTIQDNIRNFISYSGSNWSDPKPKYFLFAADLDSIPNFSFRSVDFLDYDDTSHSDYYYGVDTADLDTTKLSYSIGRVAARNDLELKNYFNKVLIYESNNYQEEWNNAALFVTDDEYGGNDIFEDDFFVNTAKSLANKLPNFINIDFVIPIDTSIYFGNKESIISKLNSGNSSVFFIGHGMNEIFTHESLFVADDVDKLTNDDKPFYISIICAQQFARNNETSIVNEMIVSGNAALASINSVGITFSYSSSLLYENLLVTYIPENHWRIYLNQQ